MQRILISCLLMLVSCIVFAQQTKLVTITNTPLSYTPKLFHIVSVKDTRPDTSNVGVIGDAKGQKIAYNLSDGLSRSLMNYIDKNISQDIATLPFEISFKRLELVRKIVDKKDMLYLFGEFKAFYDSSDTYSYSGSTFIPITPAANIALLADKITRYYLERAFSAFDEWLTDNKENVYKRLDVEIIVAKESNDNNEVMYNIRQPLTAGYFLSKPRTDENAYFDYGLTYDYHYDYQVNRKKVTFTIEPYMRKDKSWITNSTDTVDLNFFQVLYDINAVKACELFALARTTSFSYDNVLKEFESLYDLIETSRGETVKAYESSFDKKNDYETMVSKHNEWAIKVKKQLVNCACYQ